MVDGRIPGYDRFETKPIVRYEGYDPISIPYDAKCVTTCHKCGGALTYNTRTGVVRCDSPTTPHTWESSLAFIEEYQLYLDVMGRGSKTCAILAFTLMAAAAVEFFRHGITTPMLATTLGAWLCAAIGILLFSTVVSHDA